MRYKVDADGFSNHLSELKYSGQLDDIYANPGERLDLANLACDAIQNAGGVVSGSSSDLFSHAMTGLPELSSSRSQDTLTEPHRQFTGGIQSLAGQFTGKSADRLFIPGNYKGNDRLTFKVSWSDKVLPRWVNVRSQLPYKLFTNGGWGLEPDDTSIEYMVRRSQVTGEVVGQVVARESIRVDFAALVGTEDDEPYTKIQMPTERGDVVLYQAARQSEELPLRLPQVVAAKFGLDIVRLDKRESDEEIQSGMIEALSGAVLTAKHRGDYNGTPMVR